MWKVEIRGKIIWKVEISGVKNCGKWKLRNRGYKKIIYIYSFMHPILQLN